MIRLPWPPTVNTYYTVSHGRKIMSVRGRAFKGDAVIMMLQQKIARGLNGDVAVSINAHPPDKRKRDIDNIIKPILDVMTDYGVFEDDSQVVDLRIQRFLPTTEGRVDVYVSAIYDQKSDGGG